MDEPVQAHRWVSAHIYYHHRLDPLLTGTVAPLLGELSAQGLVRRWFFLRYWDGGNHLRVRALTRRGGQGPVRSQLHRRCEEFLRTSPAPPRSAQDDYPAIAARLAAQEGLIDYLRAPRPNNTIEFRPYRPEHHRYGYDARLAAVERHFAESSRIALRVIGAGATAGDRRTAAVAMIALAWLIAAPAGLAADRRPPAPAVSPELAALYRRQRERLSQLGARMRRLAEAVAGHAGTAVPAAPAGALADWARSLTTLHRALGQEPAQGQQAAPGLPPAAILDLCAHLACNRLGITPDEESELRYLAARGVVDAVLEGGPRAVA